MIMISSSVTPQVQASSQRLWLPKQVLVTPAAEAEDWGQQIIERVKSFGIPVTKLSQNRLTGLRGKDERETYAIAKNTLATHGVTRYLEIRQGKPFRR